MMTTKAHWEKVYQTKAVDEVSWYRPHLEVSLTLIEAATLDTGSAVIDVGGGEATLVDDLVARGYSDVTVLDISPAAIEVAKGRLGAAAASVHWVTGYASGDDPAMRQPEARRAASFGLRLDRRAPVPGQEFIDAVGGVIADAA
ncbi:MAG: class I SAM-dependent methyltransferase, partial [Brevundimonas sp.]|uniref:class I SAM-dependent methyltransferase n=1 Tax=Brevundimonas sp. TaxID=1871086 RepID=UPI0027370874